MLRRLELTGFKSFAKKTSLEFGAQISAIVGPNGSGKSNVAEAFRWVLGEQSMKSLRGKRGEDLIWNGSPGAARSNHAMVSIAFDNAARKFPVDFDEVTVSRHVYRDGTNEYYINNSPVRLKDVVELLSAVGIGASSHHIISQGEADRILSANPSERRGMIEDALGLRVYQFKREESEKKLSKTEENMKQVESLRREIKPHLTFLKKQVEKIEASEQWREELLWLARDYFNTEDQALLAAARAVSAKKDVPEEELARLTDRLAVLEAESGTPLIKQESAEQVALREKEKELYNTRLDKDTLSRALGRIEGRIDAVPKAIVVREGAMCDRCGQVLNPDARDRMSHHEEEKKQLEIERAEIDAKLRVAIADESRLAEEEGELRRAIERAVEDTRHFERELFEARAKKSQIASQLAAIVLEEEQIAMRRAQRDRDFDDAFRFVGMPLKEHKAIETAEEVSREEQEDRRRKMERLKVRLEEAGAENTDVVNEYKQVSEREEFLGKELLDLSASAESLRNIIADLECRLREEFERGLQKINGHFGEFFATMFGGGTASLALVRPPKARRSAVDEALGIVDDEPEGPEGIEVEVNLPRKKVKGLEMLSGGERALASIALLFAMSQVNPPPFLILDETDAALDEANSRRYGDMIENLAKLSQLILITHNRETMSRGDTLYGVTMGMDGVSRILSVQFGEATQYAK